MTLNRRGPYRKTDEAQRRRILELIHADNGHEAITIAHLNSVSMGTVNGWIANGPAHLPRGGARNVKITQEISDYIRSQIDNDCWVTLSDLSQQIHNHPDHNWPLISTSGLSKHIISKLNITLKIVRPVPVQRNSHDVKQQRKEYVQSICSIGDDELLKHFVFFDESGFDTQRLKSFGRAQRGQSPNPVHCPKKQRYNLIGAVSGQGTVLLESHLRRPRDRTSTINGTKILEFMVRLTDLLRVYCDSHDVDYERIHIVLDNAGIHRTEPVLDFLDNSGFTILFLPPYSPFLNAIEEVF